MNNEQLALEINKLKDELSKIKSFIEFPKETEDAIKARIFSAGKTPTSYLQTLNLTGNAQSIQVLSTPDIWVELNTPLGRFKILGYKS